MAEAKKTTTKPKAKTVETKSEVKKVEPKKPAKEIKVRMHMEYKGYLSQIEVKESEIAAHMKAGWSID